MRAERAGLMTKIVILLLMIAVVLALLSMQGKLQEAQRELDAMTRQVQAQSDINAGLIRDIENSTDGGNMTDVARERLGLVEPDEKVFVDANH